MGLIRDEDFIELWKTHGKKLTWKEYAEELTSLIGVPISEAALKMWISRNRDRLLKNDVDTGQRKVSAAEEFNAWPALPRTLRNDFLYRMLEYHARVKQLGEDALFPSIKSRYLATRRRMIDENLVIRYSPKKGLYLDGRSERETREDPTHTRLSETREVYLRRHGVRARSDDPAGSN